MALLTTGTENITQIWEILHDFYLDEVVKHFPRYVHLLDRIKRSPLMGGK